MLYKKYRLFLESSTKKVKPGDFLNLGVRKFTSDGHNIEINQNVILSSFVQYQIPIKFYNINGDFNVSFCRLTSLKNCPDIVDGTFTCSGNNLLPSLEFCPKKVTGFFWCIDIPSIKSIEDYPLCIIGENIFPSINPDIPEEDNLGTIFPRVCKIIKSNIDLFEPLLDNKIAFHRMIMTLDSSLIKYYTTIDPPSKNRQLLI